MASKERTDAVRKQLREALVDLDEHELKKLISEEREEAHVQEEVSLMGLTPPAPVLPANEWAALKDYLISDAGRAFDPQRALVMAYQALKEDNQARFWVAILSNLRGHYRNHPEVHKDRMARSRVTP